MLKLARVCKCAVLVLANAELFRTAAAREIVANLLGL